MSDIAGTIRLWMHGRNPQVMRSLSIRFFAELVRCEPTDPALTLALDLLETEGLLKRCVIFDDGADGVVFGPEDVREAYDEGSFVHPGSGIEIPLDDPRLFPYWDGSNGA